MRINTYACHAHMCWMDECVNVCVDCLHLRVLKRMNCRQYFDVCVCVRALCVVNVWFNENSVCNAAHRTATNSWNRETPHSSALRHIPMPCINTLTTWWCVYRCAYKNTLANSVLAIFVLCDLGAHIRNLLWFASCTTVVESKSKHCCSKDCKLGLALLLAAY